MQIFLLCDASTGRGFGHSETSAPDYLPGPHEIPCTPEQAADPTAWRWDGAALVAADPLPPEVPRAVTSVQAKIALSRRPGSASGASLLDDVQTAIANASIEVRIWFSDARTWERSDPDIAGIGSLLGLDEAAIDDLFRAAAAIPASRAA